MFHKDGNGNVWKRNLDVFQKPGKKTYDAKMPKSLGDHEKKTSFWVRHCLHSRPAFCICSYCGLCEAPSKQSIVILFSPSHIPGGKRSFVVRFHCICNGSLCIGRRKCISKIFVLFSDGCSHPLCPWKQWRRIPFDFDIP